MPGQSPGEAHHSLRSSLVAALHGAAECVRVHLRHRRERPEDVAVGGEGVHAARDPSAQVHARVGIGLTLFTGPDSSPYETPAGGQPVTVRRLDAVTARAIGIRGGGALLVRPDATPARLWTHDARAAA